MGKAQILTATPERLSSGEWGAWVQGIAREGDKIEITTRSGRTWTAKVTQVISSRNGQSLVATSTGSLRTPPAPGTPQPDDAPHEDKYRRAIEELSNLSPDPYTLESIEQCDAAIELSRETLEAMKTLKQQIADEIRTVRKNRKVDIKNAGAIGQLICTLVLMPGVGKRHQQACAERVASDIDWRIRSLQETRDEYLRDAMADEREMPKDYRERKAEIRAELRDEAQSSEPRTLPKE